MGRGFSRGLEGPALLGMLDCGRRLPHPPPLPDGFSYYWDCTTPTSHGRCSTTASSIVCDIAASWWYSLSVDRVLCELPPLVLIAILRYYHRHGGASKYSNVLTAAKQTEHERLRPHLKALCDLG